MNISLVIINMENAMIKIYGKTKCGKKLQRGLYLQVNFTEKISTPFPFKLNGI